MTNPNPSKCLVLTAHVLSMRELRDRFELPTGEFMGIEEWDGDMIKVSLLITANTHDIGVSSDFYWLAEVSTPFWDDEWEPLATCHSGNRTHILLRSTKR